MGFSDWRPTSGSPRRQVLPQVDLADAEEARERRPDRLAVDGRPNLADAGVRLALFGRGPVELGLRDDALLQQPLHALEVDARQVTLRFRRCHLRPLLARIEQREDVSGADVLSRVERNSLDRSRQVGADRHALHGGEGADRAQRRRPLFTRGDQRRDRLRRRLKRRALRDGGLNLAELHEAQARDQQRRHGEHHNHSLQHGHSPRSRCACCVRHSAFCVLHCVDNCRARRVCATIGHERDVEVGLVRDTSGCQPNDVDLRLSTDAVIGRLDNWKPPAAPVKLADNRRRDAKG